MIESDKVQAYENKERERQKTRKVMSKKLDKDKIQSRVSFIVCGDQQIEAIEREEAAGRMTIGMRQEKSNVPYYMCESLVNNATQIDLKEISAE